MKTPVRRVITRALKRNRAVHVGGAAILIAVGLATMTAAAAADSPNPAATVNVVVKGHTVTLSGTWTWNRNCGADRFGAGWQVDWNDPTDGGHFLKTINGVTFAVGTASDNVVQYAATAADRCGTYDTVTKLSSGKWGPISHTYPSSVQSIPSVCPVLYDLHFGTKPNVKPGDLVAGGVGPTTAGTHNTDNSVESSGGVAGGACTGPITLGPAGGIFVTGHDSDYHGQPNGPDAVGAQHIIQKSIAYVTFGKASPKILLVTDRHDPGSGFRDPRKAMELSGFTTFDVGDDGSTAGVVVDSHPVFNVSTVDFSTYDVIVVASDHGGWLAQSEVDMLTARANDVLNFINGGGGVVAFSENGGVPGVLPNRVVHDRFGFFNWLGNATYEPNDENGFQLTAFGSTLGLIATDVNGNVSHNLFDNTRKGGLDVVDVDGAGHIITLATRGKTVTANGV